ncbi:u-box domain protein [Stylonychia lemnae]|uniref:RING-type E3 ubiquitin transferase n=1 Tax=Stylonychia lemnae TaxID=5949 RepID=A0A078A6C8_STYLE|nr:u-box domain protein [Stylonychia lemnae]|eukprot:CDW77754.1 u-box domain protein [Stylonychia lemnae]
MAQETKELSIQFKDQGNLWYSQKDYQKAIELYSRAIMINDNNPTFYLNRAKCFKMLKTFDKQYQDSLKAIELDDSYIKAYIVNGEALVELGKNDKNTAKIEKGILRMKKALNMCFKQNQKNFEKEIQTSLKKAEKIKWYKQTEIDSHDKERLMYQIRGKMDNHQDDQDILGRFEKYLNQTDPRYEETKNQAREHRSTHKEIPDFLICRITDDLMEQPVVIQSGFTYEKSAILKHFQINGNIDPITRQSVDPNILIPNHYLKQATEYYLERNPWAFQYIPGELYLQYHM